MTRTYGDIVTTNAEKVDPLAPVGIAAAKLDESQRAQLVKLIEVYARTFEPALAEARMARVRDGGIENIRFGWAGATERGRQHYYRVQGPLFLIEYDATQDGGNHVHTVWRDFTGTSAATCCGSTTRTPKGRPTATRGASRPLSDPRCVELFPVWRLRHRHFLAGNGDFLRILASAQFATHHAETLIDEVGVHHVAFAVVAHIRHIACRHRRRDLAAVHAQLARKTAQPRHRVESGAGARLVHRQHVHQIEMPCVIAAEVAVPLEFAVLVAPVPEFLGLMPWISAR